MNVRDLLAALEGVDPDTPVVIVCEADTAIYSSKRMHNLTALEQVIVDADARRILLDANGRERFTEAGDYAVEDRPSTIVIIA